MPERSERSSRRLAYFFAIAVLCLISWNAYRIGQFSALTRPMAIEWPNDAARAEQVEDDRRAKEHPEIMRTFSKHPELYYISPDGRRIEFGLREDGVVLWREAPAK